MHSLAVSQQHDAEVTTPHLRDCRPATDATVGLDLLSHRMLDDMLDPLQPNDRTVRAQPHRFEVSRELEAPDWPPWQLSCGASPRTLTRGAEPKGASSPTGYAMP